MENIPIKMCDRNKSPLPIFKTISTLLWPVSSKGNENIEGWIRNLWNFSDKTKLRN